MIQYSSKKITNVIEVEGDKRNTMRKQIASLRKGTRYNRNMNKQQIEEMWALIKESHDFCRWLGINTPNLTSCKPTTDPKPRLFEIYFDPQP